MRPQLIKIFNSDADRTSQRRRLVHIGGSLWFAPTLWKGRPAGGMVGRHEVSRLLAGTACSPPSRHKTRLGADGPPEACDATSWRAEASPTAHDRLWAVKTVFRGWRHRARSSSPMRPPARSSRRPHPRQGRDPAGHCLGWPACRLIAQREAATARATPRADRSPAAGGWGAPKPVTALAA